MKKAIFQINIRNIQNTRHITLHRISVQIYRDAKAFAVVGTSSEHLL